MAKQSNEDGLFVYEISASESSVKDYIVSYRDQVANLLNHSKIDKAGLKETNQIIIKRLGEVLINPLTLERLVEDEKKKRN